MNTNRDKRVEESIDRANEGIKFFFSSDEYTNYLKIMSRFRSYSFANCVLIAMQRPSATMVAGYNDWSQNYQRNVVRGERGIPIITPMMVTTEEDTHEVDPEGNKIIKKHSELTFKRTFVFDISQTRGAKINIAEDELKKAAGDFVKISSALQKCTTAKVVFQNVSDDSFKGSYDMVKNVITIKTGMSEADTLKVLVQKVAESRIMRKDIPEDKKVENRIRYESAAYIISESLGFDTSDFDLSYVKDWGKSQDVGYLKMFAKSIKTSASYIIRDLERVLSTSLGKTLSEEDKIRQVVQTKLGLSKAEAAEVGVAVFDKKDSASDVKTVFHVHVFHPNGSYNGDFVLHGNEEKIREVLTDKNAQFQYLNQYLEANGIGVSIMQYSPNSYFDFKYDYIGRNLTKLSENNLAKDISAVVSLPNKKDEDMAFRRLNEQPISEDGNIIYLNTVKNEGKESLSENYVERLEIYRDRGYDSAWPMIDVAYSNTDRIQPKKINLLKAVQEFSKLPEEVLSDRSIYLKMKISYVFNDHLYETVQNIDISTCRDNFIDYLRLPDNIISHLKRHYTIMDLSDQAEHFAPGTLYGDVYADEMQEWAEYVRMELNHNSDNPVVPRPPEFDPEITNEHKDWRIER